MKRLSIFIWVLLLCFLLSGCQAEKEAFSTSGEGAASAPQNADTAFEYLVMNDAVFRENGGGGMNMWFNQWYVNDRSEGFVKDFVIGGKAYKTGLGVDGLPNDGVQRVDFSLVKYQVVKGKYSEIRGVFGFDDRTKVRGVSKLIILADDKIVYESPQIDESRGSVEVKTAIPEDVRELVVKFEVSIVDNIVPKVVFGDVRVWKAE